MPNKIYYTWENIAIAIDTLCVGLEIKEFVGVYGIPRGGCIVATILSHRLDIPYINRLDIPYITSLIWRVVAMGC